MASSIPPTPRTNRERTEATRQALLDAARGLFVGKGYADTSTPEIVQAAGITRGALYHHFTDKRDLFRQVLVREAEAVAACIEAAAPAPGPRSPREALLAGSEAYLDAMRVPGRTRLLLVDGPAVLGREEITAIDEAAAAGTLREGLESAGAGDSGVSLDALARLLSAAFDRAALEIDGGADTGEVREAMRWLLQQAVPPEQRRRRRPAA